MQGNIYFDSPDHRLAAAGISLSLILGTTPEHTWLVCKKRLAVSRSGRHDALEVGCRTCRRHLPASFSRCTLTPVRYLRHLGLAHSWSQYAVSRQERHKVTIQMPGDQQLYASFDRVRTWPVTPGSHPTLADDGETTPVSSRWLEIECNGSSGPALIRLDQWAARITEASGRTPSRISKSQYASETAGRGDSLDEYGSASWSQAQRPGGKEATGS